MSLVLALALAGQADMSPIDVPYQALPAFKAYRECVEDRFRSDPRSRSYDASQVRQANVEATAACREVRAEQLARGMAAVADRSTLVAPNYRNRADAQAAVGRAFDRFDADFVVEAAPDRTDNAED